VRFRAVRAKWYGGGKSTFAANVKFAPVVKAILHSCGVLPGAERLSTELVFATFVRKPCG